MSTDLVYDPHTKTMIRDELYEHIYRPVREQFRKRLHTLITKNSALHGNTQAFMRFRNVVYHTDNPGQQPRVVNTCHKTLLPLMTEYADDLDKMNNEEVPYVLGFITAVLNSSNSLQDYLRLFPECIHKPVEDLIRRCGCRQTTLAPERVDEIRTNHQIPIEVLKQRMVMNLLLFT